jgi:symplekin
MDGMIREFALQMLRKLQLHPAHSTPMAEEDVRMNRDGDQNEQGPILDDDATALNPMAGDDEEGHDENMEDGQLPPEDLVHTPYLPERIELPAQKSHVLQHVELLFALSVKVPEFLDEYVAPCFRLHLCQFVRTVEFSRRMAKWMLPFRKLFKT